MVTSFAKSRGDGHDKVILMKNKPNLDYIINCLRIITLVLLESEMQAAADNILNKTNMSVYYAF